MQSIAELKSKQDIPVISMSKQGLVTFINQQFTDTYGWLESDLIGKPLSTIIPVSMRDAHNLGFSRFLLTETATLIGKPLPLKIKLKSGTELDAEHCIIAEKINGEWEFAATIGSIRSSNK
jgi:PAS domain S-box-containing protein